MVCIYCHSKTKVLNSRHSVRNNGTWRRRICTKCSAVFTTNEVAQYNALWAVIDPITRKLEPFERDRLFLGIYDSCKHRKSARIDAAALTDTIISRLIKAIGNGSIDKSVLTTLTYTVLNQFDKVAGVYYKAYHGPIK